MQDGRESGMAAQIRVLESEGLQKGNRKNKQISLSTFCLSVCVCVGVHWKKETKNLTYTKKTPEDMNRSFDESCYELFFFFFSKSTIREK